MDHLAEPEIPLGYATWDGMFQEAGRRRINGGPKASSADEITWHGQLGDRQIRVVSRVRLNDPRESFHTSSGHRLRDSKVGSGGHYVDMRVSSDVTDAELAFIQDLAQAADSRLVVVSRGTHAPARPRRF